VTRTFDATSIALIAITDDLRDGADGLVARAAAAVRGGATMVQVRLKHVPTATLVEVTRALVAAVAVPVLVNDRVDVALAAGAAGAHLGFDDLPIAAARRLVPDGFIIGASVGDEAEAPAARGADYVGIGPVFATASKADAGAAIGTIGFSRLAALVGLPAVAVGGISPVRVPMLREAGAHGIAVIRSIFGADDPESAARAMRSAAAP
jgi:thiamine-phosphate pyrophosphorylase